MSNPDFNKNYITINKTILKYLYLNTIIKYYDIKLLLKGLTDIFFLHLFPLFVVKGNTIGIKIVSVGFTKT